MSEPNQSNRELLGTYNAKLNKILLNVLVLAVDEIEDLFRIVNQDGKGVISARLQLIALFTLIDILGNYYNEFLGKGSTTHTERFNTFVETFCFSDQNEKFKERKHMKGINANTLRNLRNGLVHFYGIGTQKDIIIISSDLVSSADEKADEIMKGIQRSSISKDPVIVEPSELKDIIKRGASLMAYQFGIDDVEAVSDAYKLGQAQAIDRVWKKIMAEGSLFIKPEELTKQNKERDY